MEDTAVATKETAQPVTAKICSHCKTNTADPSLHSLRAYCQSCWQEINRKKSESMKAKKMKRSNKTRAAMSASKRVARSEDEEKWNLFYNYYLERLQREEELERKTAMKSSSKD